MVSAAVDWWVDRPVMSRRRLVDSLAQLLWGGFAGLTPAAPSEATLLPETSERVLAPTRKGS
jgi:hypothetical protein